MNKILFKLMIFLSLIMIFSCTTIPSKTNGKSVFILPVERIDSFNNDSSNAVKMIFFRNYLINIRKVDGNKKSFQIPISSDEPFEIKANVEPGKYEIYEIVPYVIGNKRFLTPIATSIIFDCYQNTITIIPFVFSIELYKSENGYPDQKTLFKGITNDSKETITNNLLQRKNTNSWKIFN